MKHILLTLALLFSIGGTCQAQNIRVKTSVSAHTLIENQIISKINKQLRNFNDVEIVDTDWTFYVQIVGIETHNVGGNKTGYAASIVITEAMTYRYVMDAILNPNIKGKDRDELIYWLNQHVTLIQHYIQTASNLDDLCESIISDVDADVLEPHRKLLKEIKKKISQ